MGKPKKRTKKFNYNKNRRKDWKKSKTLPKIKCKQIQNAWDEQKSLQNNLKEMGLAADPNKTIPLPRGKDLIPGFEMEVERPESTIVKKTKSKLNVVKELEEEANQPQEKRLKLADPEIRYCVYMMEKYGEDYKAMARDPKNYYQDTPKQIRRKIMTFKNIPGQYQAYLKSKEHKMDTT